ncbi:hypothetical protein AeNC1_016138 [Aphanomyces euteiches]|nr:hypothetical protein AeNC1_017932 [Aphanomyces euteiches]KAH9181886.1 hypothetical protein AeNC1_016138 [Aphanomyces euteiches]
MAEADRLRKREYIRRFMQQYRGKQRKAKDMLRSQIESLEAHVAMMMEQTKQQKGEESTALLLPWKEVATAVNELRQESVTERRRLTKQIREYKQVIEEMKTWVAASSSFVSQPNSCRDTWRNFSLLAHPTSRRLGKQWIIQHMYHNLDQVFQHYGLPAANTAPPLLDQVLHYKSMEILFTDEGRHSFVQKLHKCWNAPLDVVVALFRGQTGSMFTMDAFHPIDSQTLVENYENTTLHQYGSEILLCGEFRDDDRVVLVIQQIQEDESIPHTSIDRRRRRMVWIELRQISPEMTQERYLCVVSHESEADENYALALEEQGRQWGVDISGVDPDQRENILLRAYRQYNIRLAPLRQEWYSGLVKYGREKVAATVEIKEE